MITFRLENTSIAPAVDGLVHLKTAEEEFCDDCMKCEEAFILTDFREVGVVEVDFHQFLLERRNGGGKGKVARGKGAHGELELGLEID